MGGDRPTSSWKHRWGGTTATATDRGQVSLSVVEAGIGVVLVLAVTATFGLGLPAPDTREAQLDAYADDAVTVLSGEPPQHGGPTRLAEVAAPGALSREGDALERRVARILPANLLFRVVTPHGAVGYRKPTGVPLGRATVTTLNGEVTIWVWYS